MIMMKSEQVTDKCVHCVSSSSSSSFITPEKAAQKHTYIMKYKHATHVNL